MDQESFNQDMLDVLKDLSAYLSKAEEDATLEKVSLEDKPKIGESQAKKDPIKHGTDPNGRPGEDVIKAEDDDDDEDYDDDDDEVEGEEDDDDEDKEELKSLLKDIRNALSVDQTTIVKAVASELKKSLPNMVKGEIPNMLRKMGFSPTRPDVVRLGLDDEGFVKKSEDDMREEVDIQKAINDLSKKSWSELAQMRQNLGDFNHFPR